jgi:hypothetical protein
MADLVPAPPNGNGGANASSPGRLPREETHGSFYGFTLTNKRILVELPDYLHTVNIEQLNEMALTLIPLWQRFDAVWGLSVRGGLVSLVAGGFLAAAAGLLVPGEPLAWMFALAVAAAGLGATALVTLYRLATSPTCVVNLATSQGVAAYPVRIPASEMEQARQSFMDFLTRAMTLREDPSTRRTLGFGMAERQPQERRNA